MQQSASTARHLTSEIDGVTVHHFPSDDDVTDAVLVFGAGTRDESLPEQGVLHALEHIVMDAVRRTPLEINASVGPSDTEFTVSGRPELVGDLLTRLCAALADPPVQRLEAEAPIIAAEIDGEAGPEEALLAARYGLRDLGSGSVPGPGPDGLRTEQVRTAAAAWFVAGNAVLLVDGPVPADLRLPLSPGSAPAHRRQEPRRWPGPHAITMDGPACLASILLPPSADRLDALAEELVRTRLMDAVRHRDGLSYVVDGMVLPAGDGWQDLLVNLEPPEERVLDAVRAMVSELRSLLLEGPSDAELEQARGRLIEARLGRRAQTEVVRGEATASLLGLAQAPVDAEQLAQIDREAVAAYLLPLERDLLFLLPDHPELRLDQLGLGEAHVVPSQPGDLPDGRLFRPPLLARALSSGARQASLVLTPDGLVVRLEGEVSSVRWDEVAGVMFEDDDEAAVFGLSGAVVTVGPKVWRDGRILLDEVRRRVPSALVYRRSALLTHEDDLA